MSDPSRFIARHVIGLPRSGIRDFFDVVAKMKSDDVISLGIGEPDFRTPWHIREAAIYSLERGRTHYTANLFVAGVNATIAKPPHVPDFRALVAKMIETPWVQRPDFPSEDAHLLTWGTADEFVVFCPNLNFFTRGTTQQAAFDAMQERIRQHTLSGERIPVITTPKQTLYFSNVDVTPGHA